jgi:hypothetical protein
MCEKTGPCGNKLLFALFYLSPYQAEPGHGGLWMDMDADVDAVKVVEEARVLLTYLDSRGEV